MIFGLSGDMGFTSFILSSPKFNSTSEAEFKKIFSLGKKQLGNKYSDFNLTIQEDNRYYFTNNLNPGQIEILKTEDFFDHLSQRSLRVWFRVNTNLSSCSCQGNKSKLTNGLMVAEFTGYRNGW